MRRVPPQHRHRTRRRRNRAIAEPHRVSGGVLLAGADRRRRQQGQSRFSRSRARVHPEILRQPRLCVPPRVQGLRLRCDGQDAAGGGAGAHACHRRRRFCRGRVRSRRRHRRQPADCRRRPCAHESRRGVSHGVHLGDDRRPEMRAALLQHHALHGQAAQSRHGGERSRRPADLSSGRIELGLHLPDADHHGGSARGAAGAVLRAGGA